VHTMHLLIYPNNFAEPLAVKKIMEQHGFKALDTEWWHYYLPNTNFELLNISFTDLKTKKIKTNDKRKRCLKFLNGT
jgi:hypothetical protein